MKSTRKAYGEYLVKLGEKDSNVVVLDADLAQATCTNLFKEAFPQRHFDIGIAEQDLVGTACGMALDGKTVFASSFAMFLAGRAYEQIRNTAAYSHVNVQLCATHTGLAVGEDGATHQCIEDIALMNVIPNMHILCPADAISTNKILDTCLAIEGPKYVRLGRSEVEDIYREDDTFKIGGSHQFGIGKDATIFCVGNTVSIALEAKQELEKEGILARVVDLYSIKPIDKDTILKSAKETKILVSIEDHSVIGGIGSIISDILTQTYPKKLFKIGVQDIFGKSGSVKELYQRYGITKEAIVQYIKEMK